jgi:hypothetical protein
MLISDIPLSELKNEPILMNHGSFLMGIPLLEREILRRGETH